MMTTSVEDRVGVEDRVSRLEGAYEHLATKADLLATRGDIKEDMGKLEVKIEREIGELRAEFKEDLGKLHASLVKWMVGVMVGGVGAMAGIALLIQRLSG